MQRLAFEALLALTERLSLSIQTTTMGLLVVKKGVLTLTSEGEAFLDSVQLDSVALKCRAVLGDAANGLRPGNHLAMWFPVLKSRGGDGLSTGHVDRARPTPPTHRLETDYPSGCRPGREQAAERLQARPRAT